MVPASAQRGMNFKAETGKVLEISKEGDAAVWSMGSIVLLKTFFLDSAATFLDSAATCAMSYCNLWPLPLTLSLCTPMYIAFTEQENFS